MSYKLILRQDAERDLVEACKWYEEKVPGLGTAFLAAIERGAGIDKGKSGTVPCHVS